MKKDIGITIKRVKRVNTARTGVKKRAAPGAAHGMSEARGSEHPGAAGTGQTDRPRVRRPLSAQINITTIMLS